MLSRATCLALLLLAAVADGAAAATLNVAAGGVDADGCGTKAAPCRSIGRAIAAAAPGDKILVGGGRYGDLDADGVFGEPGEETSDGSMILVDKRLTIESIEGAATTLIDAKGASFGIAIDASGTRLGKAKKGFTVTGATSVGVIVGPQTTDVVVSGVRAVRNRLGFGSKASGLTFKGDIAEANGTAGFSFTGNAITITGSRATGNGEEGFAISGNASVLKADVASANGGAGFQLFGDGDTLTGSVAAGNDVGLAAGGSSLVATGNSFLGNVTAGVVVVAAGTTISKSNVFGNGATGGNCGVTTAGSGTVTLDEICFGAPTGPGDDPADQVCGVPITILEVIEKVIKITPKVPL